MSGRRAVLRSGNEILCWPARPLECLRGAGGRGRSGRGRRPRRGGLRASLPKREPQSGAAERPRPAEASPRGDQPAERATAAAGRAPALRSLRSGMTARMDRNHRSMRRRTRAVRRRSMQRKLPAPRSTAEALRGKRGARQRSDPVHPSRTKHSGLLLHLRRTKEPRLAKGKGPERTGQAEAEWKAGCAWKGRIGLYRRGGAHVNRVVRERVDPIGGVWRERTLP